MELTIGNIKFTFSRDTIIAKPMCALTTYKAVVSEHVVNSFSEAYKAEYTVKYSKDRKVLKLINRAIVVILTEQPAVVETKADPNVEVCTVKNKNLLKLVEPKVASYTFPVAFKINHIKLNMPKDLPAGVAGPSPTLVVYKDQNDVIRRFTIYEYDSHAEFNATEISFSRKERLIPHSEVAQIGYYIK